MNTVNFSFPTEQFLSEAEVKSAWSVHARPKPHPQQGYFTIIGYVANFPVSIFFIVSHSLLLPPLLLLSWWSVSPEWAPLFASWFHQTVCKICKKQKAETDFLLLSTSSWVKTLREKQVCQHCPVYFHHNAGCWHISEILLGMEWMDEWMDEYINQNKKTKLDFPIYY